ncbi:hypothetical protein F5144DRAFT_541013 [Chaetomium tenue]|uniref:Uncharacterized protein n=1 Tax=Chaetomium tenue TaxID=1854479 RepID=A0ACB7NUQ5_9PEZI|nr:hypothetical protein F5144DRAFT_541013 [Chaetomium globosum]
MTKDWSRPVFRLRKIPNGISNPAEAAQLLSGALAIPVKSITIFSLAETSNRYEVPPSKVATLQLTSVPSCISKAPNDDEWEVLIPEGSHNDVLLLDTHFRVMTALGDVEPAKHRADCIAISGLASHPFGSWQPHGPDKSFMWIRDVIPKSVPGVRTVIYGYDSKLVGSNSFQSISDMARTLTLQLKAAGWSSPSSKPTIFLAHSLGGLVLKEAIVQMADREKSVATILDNVLGAIMFGVPSLGMEQSHLLAMVEGRPTEPLVQDLSRDGDSNYLVRLNERFESLAFLSTARIMWAYETERTPTTVQLKDGSWSRNGPSEVLVSRDSATCRHSRNNKSATIPINQNHSNMVKFSRGDATIGTIITSIKEICSPSNLLQRSDMNAGVFVEFPEGEAVVDDTSQDIAPPDLPCEETLKILGKVINGLDDLHNSLHSPELDFRIDQIEDPFTDTFQFVFELDEFSRWLRTGSDLFWIHGKPGSGKSTLMKYIFHNKATWELLHNWRTGSLEVTAAFFFHYRGTTIQKSFEGVLRSLITQILSPHRVAYESQHRPTWQKYESIKSQQKRITAKYKVRKKEQSDTMQKISRQREHLGQNRDPESEYQLRQFEQQEPKLKSKLHQIEQERKQELQQSTDTIALLAADFEQHSTSPLTMFLETMVSDTSKTGHWSISTLESLLRRLLEQKVTKMDLVLFFDALDEFDGNLDLISRFLKDLARPPATKSMTRVKVLFSSRPWKQLKDHFSEYPGFALQDHTKSDIERYAAGRVANSPISGHSLALVLPFVIAKADGVFLWVRLALTILIEQASSHRGQISADALKAKLLTLPADLFEFYELIIERISKSSRRQTYALLELLIRHNGPPLSAVQLRDAVLVSECPTYDEARRVLEASSHRSSLSGIESYLQQANNDIYSWGGGLVEIKKHGPSEATENKTVYRPQLMHQTVLEFAMGLSLCLRDWIASKPGELERLVIPIRTHFFIDRGLRRPIPPYPLLSSLVFAPSQGEFGAGDLTTIKLLLENGYTPKREPQFFHRLMKETWVGICQDSQKFIRDEALHDIIRLALAYGANPSDLVSDISPYDAPPIHIAPPQLVEDLILHGAKPNTTDREQCTPLDWAIRLPDNFIYMPKEWNLKGRYDTCNILLRHGGTCNQGERRFTRREVKNLLEKFEEEGYDVEFLTARLSEMPGLAGLREYGKPRAQFGKELQSTLKPTQPSIDETEEAVQTLGGARRKKSSRRRKRFPFCLC